MSHTDAEPNRIFVTADRISGTNDVVIEAEGNVELRKVGESIQSDRITYNQQSNEVDAVGHVRLTADQDVITGPKLHLRLGENVGYLIEPRYTLRRFAARSIGQASDPSGLVTEGKGHAERIDFEGENHYRLSEATYSTCKAENPDWYVKSATIKLDYEREVGTATDARLIFLDKPILYSPWLTFSLNNQRKSGFLTPSLATTTTTGTEVTVPYFWNIAPNHDATITPRVMTKRGVLVAGEYRYLNFNYSGVMRGELLPGDRITRTDRNSLSIAHAQNFGRGFTGSFDFNRVSDDRYFIDLASRLAATSQTNLLRQGMLSYTGDWWQANVLAQRFQTLQDTAIPVIQTPYYRLPQITVNAYRPDLPFSSAFTLNGEYVDFSNSNNALVAGTRSTFYPQLSWPLRTSALYFTPKLGVRTTTYNLVHQPVGTPNRISRSWPIVTLDSGVSFERPINWAGQAMTQTLEPRLYYLYVPTRDQSQVPVFDTGIADLNAAQIFSENRYSGGDRVGDANQITAALTSRLIDPATGGELARILFGQVYYFKQQAVVLPGEVARTNRAADFLLAASGRVLPKVSVDAAWQYNSKDGRSNRIALGASYQPEIGKVLNASYRYNRDLVNPGSQVNQINQIDISGQWPLSTNWYAVGRYNYSLRDRSIIETIGGLEYNGGCWIGRVVLHRFATATATRSTGLFVQLELNGFASIGSNPMDVLRRTIPGYSRINVPGAEHVGSQSPAFE